MDSSQWQPETEHLSSNSGTNRSTLVETLTDPLVVLWPGLDHSSCYYTDCEQIRKKTDRKTYVSPIG